MTSPTYEPGSVPSKSLSSFSMLNSLMHRCGKQCANWEKAAILQSVWRILRLAWISSLDSCPSYCTSSSSISSSCSSSAIITPPLPVASSRFKLPPSDPSAASAASDALMDAISASDMPQKCASIVRRFRLRCCFVLPVSCSCSSPSPSCDAAIEISSSSAMAAVFKQWFRGQAGWNIKSGKRCTRKVSLTIHYIQAT